MLLLISVSLLGLFVIPFILSKFFYKLCNNVKRDSSVDIMEFIKRRGLHAELHTLYTNDGYKLKIHRMYHTDNKDGAPDGKTRPVVVLFHGMAAHSAHFVINSDKNMDDSVGFALAKRGQDVWMPNFRGGFFTLGHKLLDFRRNPQFWDFSMQEMIEHDMRALLDYVINHTNSKAGNLTP